MTEIEIKNLTREQISQEHPIRCVCGRLCTGLHETQCAKFRKAVENRIKKIKKHEQDHPLFRGCFKSKVV